MWCCCIYAPLLHDRPTLIRIPGFPASKPSRSSAGDRACPFVVVLRKLVKESGLWGNQEQGQEGVKNEKPKTETRGTKASACRNLKIWAVRVPHTCHNDAQSDCHGGIPDCLQCSLGDQGEGCWYVHLHNASQQNDYDAGLVKLTGTSTICFISLEAAPGNISRGSMFLAAHKPLHPPLPSHPGLRLPRPSGYPPRT